MKPKQALKLRTREVYAHSQDAFIRWMQQEDILLADIISKTEITHGDIYKLVGKKCSEYAEGCVTCDTWHLFHNQMHDELRARMRRLLED